jgi:hypothetical protein
MFICAATNGQLLRARRPNPTLTRLNRVEELDARLAARRGL